MGEQPVDLAEVEYLFRMLPDDPYPGGLAECSRLLLAEYDRRGEALSVLAELVDEHYDSFDPAGEKNPLWTRARAVVAAAAPSTPPPAEDGRAPMAEPWEMSDEDRCALPAVYHRPVFDGLGRPHSWICAVCWGDSWTTKWPCDPATAGGKELGEALGLEVHW